MFEYLGKGTTLPVVLTAGSWEHIEKLELIRQSIGDILGTPVGTVFYNEEYGSRFQDVLFEPNDDVITALADLAISEALERWEKRVELVDIGYSFEDVDNGDLAVSITVRILPSNEVTSFIFPFYKSLNN